VLHIYIYIYIYIYVYDISSLKVNNLTLILLTCVVVCDLEASRIGAPYICIWH